MNMKNLWSGVLASAALAVTGLAIAAPTTQPTTQPVAGAIAPTTDPSPAPVAAAKPDVSAKVHELAGKIRKLDDAQHPVVHVAAFDLSTAVVEKPSDFSLLSGDPSATTLRSLIDRLHHARDDKNIGAVLVTLGEPKTNLAMSQEIRDALIELRTAGKKTFVYADGYDTDTYTIATGATDICILPGGEIMIPGVGIEMMYLKNMFDKIGVKADYVQIGAYKGADEEFTRTEASKEFTGELNKLMDSLYAQVVDGISKSRNMPADQVKAAIDQSILTAAGAKDRGLVDHLVDIDGLKELMSDELGSKVELTNDYDSPDKESIDLSSSFALLAMLAKKPAVSTRPAVALVYADGVIVDGSGGLSLMDGATIGSDSIRKAMRDIGKDPSIKAVVIRINSPGGSALASEAMWQSVRRVAKTKPVIISVGNMAASGGYYLACAGDRIFADPSAIVGSIGVVGGKFVVKDLFDKLGVTTQTFRRGANADMFSSQTPFSDEQRKMVRGWMTETYDQFTQRVMSTRGGKIKKIEDVAQGRVFIAEQAKDLGMVDEIGGVQKAIEYAASQAHLPADRFEVRELPAQKTLIDLISGGASSAATALRPRVDLSDLPLIQAMPENLRSMATEQLQILQLLQQRPVVLAAPFVIRER